jgi:hypothetical protein
MLTYEVVKSKPFGLNERRTFDLVAPKEWSCYNGTSGNRLLTEKAKRFLIKIEKIKESSNSVDLRMENAFLSFIKSFDRFRSTKAGKDSGSWDSEVKWSVFDFLVNAANAVGIEESGLQALWDKVC